MIYKQYDQTLKNLKTLGVENFDKIALNKEGWKEVCNAAPGLNYN